MDFEIEVNNRKITAHQGETILSALQRNGIHVPTLCHMADFTPTGACRICMVEVEDKSDLIPACSHPVEEWMKLKTHSPRVVKARKTIVELLLANHPDDCLFCVRNNNCELQTLAAKLNVRERRFPGKKEKHKIDPSSTSIFRDPEKCILCGRCVRVCEETIGVSTVDFIGRGHSTIIGPTFNKSLNLSNCINCGQCIRVCPTGALHEKSHFPELTEALHNPDTHVVVQYSPSVPVTIAEEFGMKAGKDMNGKLNGILRKIGFDRIFDTSFAADLYTMELAAEIQNRMKTGENLPVFTSDCPGWVKYAEQFRKNLLPNLSHCKSPQQMMGTLIKQHYAKENDISPDKVYSVSLMPCTAKKFEAQREEMTHKGITDVDAVLTTRELAAFINLNGIDVNEIETEFTDNPYGERSSAGKIYGISGGVTESLMRTLYFNHTGRELTPKKLKKARSSKGRREGNLKMKGLELNYAIVNGMGNARELLDEIENGKSNVHFVEIMSCPGGCVNGGGQPINTDSEAVKSRTKELYKIDEQSSINRAHRNPRIEDIYSNFLGTPMSEISNRLLHTSYKERDVLK